MHGFVSRPPMTSRKPRNRRRRFESSVSDQPKCLATPYEAIYAFPTNDDRVLIGANWSIDRFKAARAGSRKNFFFPKELVPLGPDRLSVRCHLCRNTGVEVAAWMLEKQDALRSSPFGGWQAPGRRD